MKPKAPKKKDIKPSAKSGEVRELEDYFIPKENYINDKGKWIISFSEETIKIIQDRFFNNSDKDK